VFVTPSDGPGLAGNIVPSKYVRASEVEAYKSEVSDLRGQLAEQKRRSLDQMTSQISAYKQNYPTKLQFDYDLDKKARLAPFLVSKIYHDDSFTYIKSAAYPHPEIRAFNALSRIQAESAFSMGGLGWQPEVPHASPEKGREMLREAVRQGIVCNHIIGRCAAGSALTDSADIEVLFPDLSEVRRQLQQLDCGLNSLRPKLRDARAWAVDHRF